MFIFLLNYFFMYSFYTKKKMFLLKLFYLKKKICIHYIAKSIWSPPFNERFDYFSNFHEYKS